MAREIRNLKGEVIGVTGDKHLSDSENSIFSSQTLALIGGSALLLFGVFPDFFSLIFQVLDFRQWVWWHYPIALMLLLFCIRWLWLYFAARNDNHDTEDTRLFVRMSVFISTGTILLLITYSLTWLDKPIWLLKKWLGKGSFSWEAFFSFGVLCLFIGISFWLVRAWVYYYFADND